MLYKTIVLETLQEMHPALYQRLRLSRQLLPEMDRYATDLRAVYLKWITQGTDASAARELAVEELHHWLVQASARLDP